MATVKQKPNPLDVSNSTPFSEMPFTKWLTEQYKAGKHHTQLSPALHAYFGVRGRSLAGHVELTGENVDTMRYAFCAFNDYVCKTFYPFRELKLRELFNGLQKVTWDEYLNLPSLYDQNSILKKFHYNYRFGFTFEKMSDELTAKIHRWKVVSGTCYLSFAGSSLHVKYDHICGSKRIATINYRSIR